MTPSSVPRALVLVMVAVLLAQEGGNPTWNSGKDTLLRFRISVGDSLPRGRDRTPIDTVIPENATVIRPGRAIFTSAGPPRYLALFGHRNRVTAWIQDVVEPGLFWGTDLPGAVNVRSKSAFYHKDMK